ncbi:unnamed protein product [Eruca vesicaria subsp. sativa]|uniref:PUA domain-containing protein n=1 Tax=Eruca vesicaria subsp. sativa TaxID=29727 RepID=A0ABC8KV01_ERUVS|nr:unnamed protein product [Eruca vesicaria subsp. sativa]
MEVVPSPSVRFLQYFIFINGSGPHTIEYGSEPDNPPKEVLVSRKCAETVLRGAQVYVPGVLACTAHVEKGDAVAFCVAMEQPGDWSVNMTRGTTLQGLPPDSFCCECSGLYIGMGTAMLSRIGMFSVSHGVAVDLSNRVFSCLLFIMYSRGKYFFKTCSVLLLLMLAILRKGREY